MAIPLTRNASRDRYASEHDIQYQLAHITCQRVRWDYRIYHIDCEPKSEYGTVGDIALEDRTGIPNSDTAADITTRVWYRSQAKWIIADTGVSPQNGMPNQRHPLLDGKYRLDIADKKWKNATRYYGSGGTTASKKARRGRRVKKEQDGSDMGFKVKMETVDAALNGTRSVGDQFGGSSQAGTASEPICIDLTEEFGDTKKQTVFFHVTLNENEPPRKIALTLPLPSSSPKASTSYSAPVGNSEEDSTMVLDEPGTADDTAAQTPAGTVPSANATPRQATTSAAVSAAPSSSGPSNCNKYLDEIVPDDSEDMSFQYPEFPFSGGMLPLLSSSKQECGVQTDAVNTVERSTFMDPDTTMVHVGTSPIPESDRHSSTHKKDAEERSHTQPKISPLVERLLLESAKDRRDTLNLIRTMSERLEHLEGSAKDRRDTLDLIRGMTERIERLEGKRLAKSEDFNHSSIPGNQYHPQFPPHPLHPQHANQRPSPSATFGVDNDVVEARARTRASRDKYNEMQQMLPTMNLMGAPTLPTTQKMPMPTMPASTHDPRHLLPALPLPHRHLREYRTCAIGDSQVEDSLGGAEVGNRNAWDVVPVGVSMGLGGNAISVPMVNKRKSLAESFGERIWREEATSKRSRLSGF